MQPVTSADGQLLDRFLPKRQEKDDQFGKIVQQNLFIPPNVVVQASKSGIAAVKILRFSKWSCTSFDW